MAHWFFWVFSGLLVLGGVLRLRRSSDSGFGIWVDDEWIRRRDGHGEESVRWADLERIVIVTNDQGPMCEDVFWLFIGRDGSGCALPGAAVGDAVFDRLKTFEGVDYEAIVKAAGSTDDASFEVWQRPAA